MQYAHAKLFATHILTEITESQCDHFCLRGKSIYRVELVGRVCKVEIRERMNKLVLDDGTALITCVKWHDTEKDRQRPERGWPIRGDLVRVRGSLRMFRGDIQVNTTQVQLVFDVNEECLHWLDAMQLWEKVYRHREDTSLEDSNMSTWFTARDPMSGLAAADVCELEPYEEHADVVRELWSFLKQKYTSEVDNDKWLRDTSVCHADHPANQMYENPRKRSNIPSDTAENTAHSRSRRTKIEENVWTAATLELVPEVVSIVSKHKPRCGRHASLDILQKCLKRLVSFGLLVEHLSTGSERTCENTGYVVATGDVIQTIVLETLRSLTTPTPCSSLSVESARTFGQAVATETHVNRDAHITGPSRPGARTTSPDPMPSVEVVENHGLAKTTQPQDMRSLCTDGFSTDGSPVQPNSVGFITTDDIIAPSHRTGAICAHTSLPCQGVAAAGQVTVVPHRNGEIQYTSTTEYTTATIDQHISKIQRNIISQEPTATLHPSISGSTASHVDTVAPSVPQSSTTGKHDILCGPTHEEFIPLPNTPQSKESPQVPLDSHACALHDSGESISDNTKKKTFSSVTFPVLQKTIRENPRYCHLHSSGMEFALQCLLRRGLVTEVHPHHYRPSEELYDDPL
eukprot:Rmarinus@m.5663